MKKRSTKAVVDVALQDAADAVASVVAEKVMHDAVVEMFAAVNPLPALQDVVNMLPVDVGPAETLVTATMPDLAPVLAAAEATGLHVSGVAHTGTAFVVTCGPHVPPFTGATVAEIVAKIRAYNCKYCGSGGGHTPNCGRPK